MPCHVSILCLLAILLLYKPPKTILFPGKCSSRRFGEHTGIVTPDQEYSYARLQKDANRIAHVLLDDCGLLPGNRVLLCAPRIPT